MNNGPLTSSPVPAFADLHLLTVLAQTRSYTQAARRLGISKASVSSASRNWSALPACRWCAARRARWA